VSDPDSPQEIGFLDTPTLAWDVVVSGNLAYVADDSGLHTIDVSDPRMPRELSNDPTAPFSQLALSGNLLYALSLGGLAIFDLSEPDHPQLLTFLDSCCTEFGLDLPFSVTATEGLFVVGDLSDVRIFDASDPSAPTEQGSYQTPSIVRGLALADGIIYVADAEAGLLILRFIR
jgi:hypothetical protein